MTLPYRRGGWLRRVDHLEDSPADGNGQSQISRRRPRYIRGSAGKTVRVGRVGPGGEYAGIHVGARLRTRKHGAEYYVGVSAGRRIAAPY
jgi:hypothetical protein